MVDNQRKCPIDGAPLEAITDKLEAFPPDFSRCPKCGATFFGDNVGIPAEELSLDDKFARLLIVLRIGESAIKSAHGP